MIGIVSDPVFMNHDTGGYHPESPLRIQYLHTLFVPNNDPDILLLDPFPAPVDDIGLNHERGYINRIYRASTANTLVDLDPDTVCCPESYDVALLAAGSLVELTRMAMEGSIRSGFAFVRPPGHHARKDEAMGFCVFNNVAIAACKAVQSFGAGRVAVIDFDVHHGNGTQESFYARSDVLYFSTHQYPFYPGTGALSETGTGEGQGYTVNCPMRGGKNDGNYVAVYSYILKPLLEAYEPDLVLVSAGFDAHAMDPIGGMQVSSQGFAAITSIIQETADELGAPVVYVLEGGYNLNALKDSASRVIEVLKGAQAPSIQPVAFPELHTLINAHAAMWPLALR